MKPNRELIKIYLTMLLHEAQKPKPKQPKKGMTTEEIAQAMIDSVSQMTPLEKAQVRRAIRRSLSKPALYKRIQ